MPEQFENNFSTFLNGAIDDDDTTLTVDNVPNDITENFRIKIDNEIILVGSVSGSTFIDCERGVEGTTATSHDDDDLVEHILTAKGLRNLNDNYYVGTIAPETAFSSTSVPVANQGVYQKIRVSSDVTVSNVVFRVATQSGTMDIGIYDSDCSVRLGSTGNFTVPATGSLGNVQPLTASVDLVGGQVYYIGVVTSNTTVRLYGGLATGGVRVATGWNSWARETIGAATLPNPATPSFEAGSDWLPAIYLYP